MKTCDTELVPFFWVHLACGSDKSGQLGQGKDGKNQLVPKKVSEG